MRRDTVAVVEVAPGVHRLTKAIVNWYAIEDGGKLTLIDAGTPADWSLLLSTLQTMGRVLDDVDAVLLTHAHADHTGFAERARSEAHATIHVHGADAAVARNGKTGKRDGSIARHLLHAEAYRTLFSLIRRGGARIIPIAEVKPFEDGAQLDVPGKPRAVHVPGHTPGSCAVWLEDRSVIFTGDTLVTRNPLTGRVGPQTMPSAFNTDSAQAMRSLEALQRTARLVLPGHGEPWTEGAVEAVRLARIAGRS